MGPAAAQHAHRQSFHLVRFMVAKQKMENARLPAGAGQNLVADDPCPFRQPGTMPEG